jgi:hypothetical protein
MSDLSLVRTIIQDKLTYGVSQATGDDTTVEFQHVASPIYPDSANVYVDGVLQTITTQYTIDEDLGLITFVTAPGDGELVEISAKTTLLSDDEITDLMGMYSDSDNAVKLAAADCLDIIASSEAMIQKRIKNLELETDGPAVAKSLRDHANTIRKTLADPMMQESGFDVIEMVYDTPGYVEKVQKDLLRNGY